MSTTDTAETTEFKPRLGALDATMIVAGGMIGSGIFIDLYVIFSGCGTDVVL